MKVAIVHELLTMKGGAEKVARQLCAMYPDADVFTLLYDKRRMGDWFDTSRVRTSFLQRFAGLTGIYNHHLYLPFFRRAIEAWDFSGYDLIVSSSSAFVHGLHVPLGCTHVCYVHSPARYLWDQTNEVLERIPYPLKKLARRTFRKLRTWDASAADRSTALAAASREVQRRIELYWNQSSTVVHPFADDAWFAAPKTAPTPEGPCIVVANLRDYKCIDRAIDACVEAHIPLHIIGDGPAKAALQARAGNGGVRFLGRLEGDALVAEVRSARALIIPGVEDFGINAVEALACGTPVISVRGGGTTEIVDDTVGALCDPTAAALTQTLRTFDGSIDPMTCRTRAERFTRGKFEQQMYSIIEAALSATTKAS